VSGGLIQTPARSSRWTRSFVRWLRREAQPGAHQRLMTAASSMDLALATTMSPRRPLGNVSNGAGDIYSNDCVQTEQWWWALDQVAVVADQLSCGWSWSCAWCSVLTFRWARRFFGGQHLSRGEVCVPATSCAFLCVTPRAQPPVVSLFPSQWPPKVSLHLFRACTVAELRFRFASPCFLRVCLSYRPALCSEPHA